MLHTIHFGAAGADGVVHRSARRTASCTCPRAGIEIALPRRWGGLMLLTRLVEYASNAADAGSGGPPAYYKPQKIRWVLELSPDGSRPAVRADTAR